MTTAPIILAVGSQNPVKLEAVRLGAASVFAELVVIGVNVPSGVRSQPVGDEEMIAGARQRAHAVLAERPEAAYGVGLEGGVVELAEGMFACAWCVISNRGGATGMASTGRFLLPPRIAELVRGGMELGEADDKVFKRANSKQSEGAVGILTHGRMTRAQFYAPAVQLALVRFINSSHYASGDASAI